MAQRAALVYCFLFRKKVENRKELDWCPSWAAKGWSMCSMGNI